MPKYRVKPGKTFGVGGRYPAGSIVELTEAEAAGFLDKLEPVAEPGLVNEVEGQEVGLTNELGAEVPEDAKLLPKEEKSVSTETAVKPKPKAQRKKATEG